jgi:putative membrane protein
MPLAAGLLLGLGLSVVTIKRMLENDTTRPATLACFCGMILASTWILLKQIRPANSSEKITTPVAILIGIAAAAAVGMLPPAAPQTQPPVYYLFGCGMLGICAMILPGISGAMILLLLGIYGYLLSLPEQLLSGIWREPLTSLTIFAAGCAAGLACFSRVLTYLMARHSVTTLSLLSGLMVGSLVRLWPFQTVIKENHQKFVTWDWPTGGWDVGSATTALLLGAGMVLALQRFAVTKND